MDGLDNRCSDVCVFSNLFILWYKDFKFVFWGEGSRSVAQWTAIKVDQHQ
jgi:hypothetical protein